MNQEQAQYILGEIKNKWNQIELGTNFVVLDQELKLYIQQSENPNLWDSPERAQMILKKLSHYQKKLQDLKSIPDSIGFVENLILEQDSDCEVDIKNL